MKYYVYRERFEIKGKIPEKSVIGEAFAQGLRNGVFDTIGVFDTWEEAKEAANKTGSSLSSFRNAGMKFWSLDLCYIEEYDEDEDEPTGNYDYANI